MNGLAYISAKASAIPSLLKIIAFALEKNPRIELFFANNSPEKIWLLIIWDIKDREHSAVFI